MAGFPPFQHLCKTLAPGNIGCKLVTGVRNLAGFHFIQKYMYDPVAVLLPQTDDAGIQSGRKTGHPFGSFLRIGLVLAGTPGKLPEKLEHILEKTRLGTPGSEINRQPDHFYGIGDSNLAANILVDILLPGMVNIVQKPYRRIILPLQLLKGLVVMFLSRIKLPGSRIPAQLGLYPFPDAMNGLCFIP